jgi:two-component system sensor histidine kinase CpxA
MKPRLTLSRKIMLLAVCNFIVVGLVFFAFLFLKFDEDMKSSFFAPTRDRIAVVGRDLSLELTQHDDSEREAIVKRTADKLGMNLYLFMNDGEQVGGKRIVLPPEVAIELGRRIPGRRGGPGSVPAPPPPPAAAVGGRGGRPTLFLMQAKGDLPYWIVDRIPVHKDGGEYPGALLVGFSSVWDSPILSQIWPWLAVVGVAALLSTLLWFPLVHGLARSIDQMMHATATIADGQFDVKIGSTKRQDEVGMLAISITRMAARLEGFVKGQKRFLGDVAHELRSPLGRMQVASEILERRVDDINAGYIADLKEDVELMSGLTDQLLTFAKAELRPDSVSLVPTRIADIVQRAVQIEAGNADVRVAVNPDIQALAEPEYLFRSVSNLVRNSLRYAGSEGPIEISARGEDGNVLISVADSGPGVPEDALEKIFQPFFRLDSSRQRKTGGSGLGLAIVRSCIEACHGSVECQNRKPSGLVVTLRLAAVQDQLV